MIETIDKDYVIIYKQMVNRPSHISIVQWLQAWEEAIEPYTLCKQCGEDVKEKP